MSLPIIDWRGNKVVNIETGTFTAIAQSYFDALSDFFNKNIGSEGVVSSTQTTSNLNIISANQSSTGAYTCQFGTTLFNSDTNQLNVAINDGTGKPTFSPILTSVIFPLPMADGGTGASIAPSSGSLIYSTSTDMALLATSANGVLVTDGSGNPSISQTIPAATQANIQIAESQVINLVPDLASKLNLSGGTMTGNLILNTNATLPLQAVPLQQLQSYTNAITINGTTNQINVAGSYPTWTLSFPSILHSSNNTLDDGSGNSAFNGTTFTFGKGTSGQPATMYLIGSSITGADEGRLWFYKSGTTPTANGDALGEIAINGVNSSGTSLRAARIMAVSTASATTTSVQTELAFRFTDPSGAEQIPLILTYQGLSLNGNLMTTTGAAGTVNFNFTGATNVTFPTSGVLATVAGTISSVVGTANRITVNTSGGVSTVDIAATYVGQTSLTTLGTITTGTWNGSLIPMAYGGTNATITATANNLVYSTSTAMALLPTANNSVLITSNTGVPSISSTLPTAVQTNITQTGTITSGVWNGTIIDSFHGGTGLGAPSPGYMLVGSASVGDWAFLTAPSAEQVLCTDPLGGIIWSSTLPSFVQLNITSLGTISFGTWNGSIISPIYGGTGVSNASGSTITLGGALAFTGSFTFTGNLSGNTSITFPTTGTLVTTSVTTLSSLIITESQVTNLTTDLAAKLNLTGGTMTGNLILNADPTAALGAVTKQYADAISAGLNIKQACYAASTASLTVTYSNGSSGVGATLTNAGTQAVFTIDGTTPPVNSRILIKDQSSTFQNGIYTLTNVGSVSTNWVLMRATDYDQTSEILPGNLIVVDNGTTNGGTGWLQTSTVTSIGTSAILFSPFNLMQVGTGLTRSGNTISLSTPVSVTNGGTGLTGTTANQILYSSAANTIGGITVVNSAGLLTGATGIPGWVAYTGTGAPVLATSPTLVTPALGTPSSGTLTNCTGLNLTTGVTGILSGTNGGTGVNNGSSTITIGGNVTFSGAFTFSGTLTANTAITFPTSGTLVNTAVTTLSSLVIAESQVTNLTPDLAAKLNLTGGTMTGNLILNANATNALQAVPLQQMTTAANSANFVAATFCGGF